MTEAEPLGGRYKIISQLGAGGFGQTFLAEDLHLPDHPQCVVKHLKPQTKEDGTLSMARRLFDTEAKVLYQLGDHDQIPRLLAHFEHNQEFYLAQELVEGEPLTNELTGGVIWSEGQVIGLLQDILEILAFVHEQQVIHRDIKPPNLMRRRCDGKIVLIDFGAVKLSTQIANPEHQTNITVSIGTQGYMPNEQLAGSPRFSSDVYAVGMLAIQALVGVHPKRLKENLSTGEIEWREQADNISPELADILDQMIRYDFRDRYPTASDALLAINHLPPELLESVPPYQPLPYEVKDKYQYQTETTIDSEILVTNPWTPVDPSAATEIDVEVNPTANTSPLSESEPIQTPTNLEVTSATSELKERKFVSTKLWIVSGVLGVLTTGVAILIGKNLLPQHFFASMVNPVEIPAKSPIVATTPSPVASPRKLSATELLDEAEGFRKAGDFSQALAKYDQAIALKPKVAKAYWGRCYTLNKLNKPAEAVVSCNDALDINPDYAEALWSKAQAFDKQKLTLQALQLYEEVTRIKPDFMEGWLSYGISLQGYGRSEEALIALERAIDLNRNSAEAWAVRGEAELNMGRIEKAVSSLNKSLQLKPDNPKVIKLRKQAQEQLGL
ncbi:MAG: serine/threonine-protein kinase [Coleofasciculaceae cyanobacterium]